MLKHYNVCSYSCNIINMYKYDFDSMTDKEILYVGAANNLFTFFLWLTAILFNVFGFEIGFTGINYVFGLPYYLYIVNGLAAIICFVFKHFQYKKHNYFENKKKYVFDTLLQLLLFLMFFLNAFFLITAESDNETFLAINWDWRILIPVLLPLLIALIIYLDLTAHRPVRKKAQAYIKAARR